MSAIVQFDLFKERPTESELMRADISSIRDSSERVRKKLFAENGALKKRIFELECRLEILEKNICSGN